MDRNAEEAEAPDGGGGGDSGDGGAQPKDGQTPKRAADVQSKGSGGGNRRHVSKKSACDDVCGYCAAVCVCGKARAPQPRLFFKRQNGELTTNPFVRTRVGSSFSCGDSLFCRVLCHLLLETRAAADRPPCVASRAAIKLTELTGKPTRLHQSPSACQQLDNKRLGGKFYKECAPPSCSGENILQPPTKNASPPLTYSL